MTELTAVPAADSFVRTRGAKAWIDRRQKLASIVPNEIVLHELCTFLSERFAQGGDHVLDLGAGTRPYAPIYAPVFRRSTAVDVAYSPHDVRGVDVFAPADDLPFDDETFDFVLCTEVLEHCPDPRAVMREIARVLRPGGYTFLTTPFLVALHDLPHDYFRYTPPALHMLAKEVDLTIIDIRAKGEYAAVLLSNLVLPWTKVWHALARRLGMPLNHPRNPLVFFPVVLPQLVYVFIWRRTRVGRLPRLARALERASYVTLGYVTTLAKPEEPRP